MNKWVESLVRLTGWSGERRHSYDWDAVRRELGTPLPSDYVELVEIFGPGWFDSAIDVLVPGSGRHLGLVEVTRERRDAFEYWFDRWDDELPGAEIPASVRSGEPVIAWGETGSAAYLFWRCSPLLEPDRWPVVIHAFNEPWDEHDMTTTEFLASLLSDSLRAEYFSYLPRKRHVFEPLDSLR